MNESFVLFSGELVERIGLTLIHSLWQVALLTFVFAACRAMLQTRKESSTSIYWSGMLTLVIALLIPVATFLFVGARADAVLESVALKLNDETRAALATEMVPGSSESRFLTLPFTESERKAVGVEAYEIGRAATPNRIATRLWSIAEFLPQKSFAWATTIWLFGVLLFFARTMIGWVLVQRLRATCSRKLSQPVREIATRTLQLFPVLPPVDFAVSKHVEVPTVIGIVRPIVLFPVSVLTELSPEQLELIIVHELAHVRRHDVLLNLLQNMVESLLFFHPCIWWVSSIVRAERENCCDDAAVSHGSPASYAKALLTLENSRPTPDLVMASNGNDLLKRVGRIAGLDETVSAPSRGVVAVFCVVILAGLLLSPNVDHIAAQEPTDEFRSVRVTKDFSKTKLGKVIDTEMDKLKQVGFSGSILVAHEGEIILVRSEGTSDAARKKKIRPTTLFEIASVTKPFTATAVMILAQQGKLDLDASIADYLPGVPKQSEEILVIDLLRHESGMPATNYGDTTKDLKTAVKTMLANGPQHDPGSRYEYWNQGYILLGEIITKAAGKPYTDFIREEIFEPAGMTGTCFCGDGKPKGFVESTGFGKLGPQRTCLEHPYGKMELVYQGTGGIVSNVGDMWKFHKALMSDKLVDQEFKARMFKKGVGYYACGWKILTASNGETRHVHSGSVRGYCAEFRRFPKSDSCIVVLANNDSAPAAMVANVIESLLLPPNLPIRKLDEKTKQKIIGEYQDAKGRILTVFDAGKEAPPGSMLYWQPTNPSAPITRSTVHFDEDGNIVFYQPGDTQAVKVGYSKDNSKIETIEYKDLNIKFRRFDIKAWAKSRK